MARAAPHPPDDAAKFEAMYRACYPDLLRFALRRTDRPESAADVVAETFLIAWRRLADIPTDQARLWLFGVARNVLANHHRADQRRHDLAIRLREELRHTEVVQPEVPDDIRTAFHTLPEADQELLRLVAWEGLTGEELAVVLGCSVNAARIRLHRARRRFAAALRDPALAR
ncbi:RNA polymerase sigma factor [Micromonospora sp. HM5-17]|uniref:RNA polymerase sigma factor n=1 Tax=Micromonospora sp. HM5-17 TaxID=2487710 RepID=UPI001F347403|nr:sigma-70 family RNA polymerase sigma factor [Micromonospora sp. HM5-17]